ncbi:MAG: carbohydrate binding domain-containing protein, partial [Candidatus Saccharimonadales bacterium]
SSVDITATNGGNVTIQGGAATVSNGNGGSLLLSGGAGSGTGVSGLVVLSTPTFSTVTNDANCYTGGAVVASSCTLTTSTINNASSAIIGFSATGQSATMPDPTITTAGRIIYVTAASGSQQFTLRANVGTDAEQNITMRKNTTATLLWNGSDWTVAGGSSSTTLQDAYTNTPQNAAGSDIVVNNDGSNTGGLTIQESNTNPVNGSLLDVKNAVSDTLFSVNSKVVDGTEHATDGGAHDSANFSTNWSADGSLSVSRNATDGQEGNDSVQVAAGTDEWAGVKNKLSINPKPGAHYRVSTYAKLVSGTAFTDLAIGYSPNDDGGVYIGCTNYSTQTITTTGWTQITCDIDTGSAPVTNPYVYISQPTAPASARTFLIDTLSFTLASNNTPNVKVGSGTGTGSITLFTLDKSATAPAAADNDSLLGSMYYDTTLGKVQCYESEGWGACGASPDIFVTISPEYTNAVMNGTDIGTITSDLCSDTLNINDGSSSQPTICGTNETYNFYKWTSAESTAQTRSIYVTYQLPSTFKNFAAGVTTLKGRTDSADSSVTYQVYRDNNSAGLATCGSAVSVSTGSQSTWQQAAASGSADPSTCGFEAGDSILFRINLTAKSNANVYVSNLSFVFNNN